jgi:branched-chain amino acid aminotransferase
VFCVENGTVLTPAHGVLDGITRRTAIELCAALDIPCEEIDISAARFLEADEVFITSTAGGIMPVTRIESRTLGNGAPGPFTQRLDESYLALHRDARYLTPVPYDD